MHFVPAAKDWTTDQVPEAHCWNEVPSTQFQRPSGEQAEPACMAPDAPEDDSGEGDALAAGDVGVDAGAIVEVAKVVVAAVLLLWMVANTPPEADGVDILVAAPATGVVPDPG